MNTDLINDDSTQIKVTKFTLDPDSDPTTIKCKVSKSLIDDLKKLHGVDALAELKKLITEIYPGRTQVFEVVENRE